MNPYFSEHLLPTPGTHPPLPWAPSPPIYTLNTSICTTTAQGFTYPYFDDSTAFCMGAVFPTLVQSIQVLYTPNTVCTPPIPSYSPHYPLVCQIALGRVYRISTVQIRLEPLRNHSYQSVLCL